MNLNKRLTMRALRYHRPVVTAGLILLSLLQAGCGFQLRGKGVLPENLQQITLICQPVKAENLCRDIRSQLTAGGISVITSQDASLSEPPNLPGNTGQSEDTTIAYENTATLVIDSVRDKRRAASLASDASAAEIELSRTVDFEFRTSGQENESVTMVATQFQTYQFTELSVLGKEKEEDQVRDNLDQLLATEILNRSTSLLSAFVNASE